MHNSISNSWQRKWCIQFTALFACFGWAGVRKLVLGKHKSVTSFPYQTQFLPPSKSPWSCTVLIVTTDSWPGMSQHIMSCHDMWHCNTFRGLSLSCPQTLQTRPRVTLCHLSDPLSLTHPVVAICLQRLKILMLFLGCRCHCSTMKDVLITKRNFDF